MSFFTDLLADAKAAYTYVQPALQLEQTLSPIVAQIPGAAPVVAAVNTGIASVEAVAPGAIATTESIISEGEALIASATPEIQALEAVFAKLFGRTVAPGATVLTPVTSAATAPAGSVAPPGNAVS